MERSFFDPQTESEAHVGSVVGWIGLIRLRKGDAAERDRGGVTRMHEPFDRLDTLRSKVDQYGLDESLDESGALLIGPDGGHHQVSVSRHGTTIGTNQTHVCRERDQFTVALLDDDLTILIGGVRIGSPTKEPGDNLGDLGEPWDRGVTDVEGVQRLGVVIGRVTQDHESVTVIDEIGPFGFQV